MNKRKRQTDFLKALILHGDIAERERLLTRMARAERDEHCSRCALILVAILSFVSFCAVCYSVVLLPNLMRGPSPTILKLLCLFGLASAICSVTFFFFWIWYRGVLNRMQDESRRFILTLLETQSQTKPKRLQLAALGLNESDVEDNGRGASYATSPRQQSYWELFNLKRAIKEPR
jgi:hypothetical protein